MPVLLHLLPGSGLFFAGYSLAMIPSQLIGLKVGVSRWLGVQVTFWGVVAASFSGTKNVTHFYLLRTLLGVAEAGAFPGEPFPPPPLNGLKGSNRSGGGV